MSNKAAELINIIQYKTGLSLNEIAEKIGYSRPYLNNVKLKGGGNKIIGVLREAFPEILHNVPQEGSPVIAAHVDEGKILSRMCEFIANNYGTIQALKADYIEFKAQVSGEAYSDLSLKLDSRIRPIVNRILDEFEEKLSSYK